LKPNCASELENKVPDLSKTMLEHFREYMTNSYTSKIITSHRRGSTVFRLGTVYVTISKPGRYNVGTFNQPK